MGVYHFLSNLNPDDFCLALGNRRNSEEIYVERRSHNEYPEF